MLPKDSLTVALFQTSLIWEDPEANRTAFTKAFHSLRPQTNLLVLPEMFSTGFSMNPRPLAEPMDGPTMNWLKEESARLDLAICGSLIIKEADKFFNRFVWVEKGSVKTIYNKRHLFTMAGEHNEYTGGKESGDFEFMSWRIRPRICYDLRFPVWCRTTASDLQIYVANWPSPRIEAWYTLLQARAIENQCYVIGVNRVGIDGNGMPYTGYSVVFNAKGEAISPARNTEEGLIYATIDKESLEAFRNKFPLLQDADKFQLLP